MNIITILHKSNRNGGANLQFLKLQHQFRINGHKCDIFYLDQFKHHSNPFLRLYYLIKYFNKLIKKYDIVFLADPIITSGFYFLTKLFRKKKKEKKNNYPVLIQRIGSVFDSFYAGRIVNTLFPSMNITKSAVYFKVRKLLRWLSIFTFIQIDLTIFNSRFLQKEYSEIKKKNDLVIYNGVDNNFCSMRKISSEVKLKTLSNKKREELRLVYIGRIEPRKSLHKLIIQVAKIKNVDFSFDIIGKVNKADRYFQTMENYIISKNFENKIKFLGFINHSDLPNILKKYDILLFPTDASDFPITEGLPNVILEALSVGLVIIATDVAGVPEIINDRNGFVLQKSFAECHEYIQNLYKNRQLLTKIQKYNIRISSKYLMSKTATQYLFYFKKIVNSSE